MSASKSLALVLVACIAFVRPALAGDPVDRPAMKLEFRRAETAPAESLTEATVQLSGQKIYLHKDAEITNADVAEARAVDDGNGNTSVGVTFTKEGAEKMAALSEGHQGKPVAILLDGKVISAPVITASLSDRAMITGNFTDAEVKLLVEVLNKKRVAESP